MHVVRGEIDDDTSNLQARAHGQKFCSSVAKKSRQTEKQHWAEEKPQLDNARNLRGVYHIDREDEEFNETLKNAGKKLDLEMDSANAV